MTFTWALLWRIEELLAKEWLGRQVSPHDDLCLRHHQGEFNCLRWPSPRDGLNGIPIGKVVGVDIPEKDGKVVLSLVVARQAGSRGLLVYGDLLSLCCSRVELFEKIRRLEAITECDWRPAETVPEDYYA